MQDNFKGLKNNYIAIFSLVVPREIENLFSKKFILRPRL